MPDLSDLIYNIAPTDTPFFAAMGRGKTTVTHEWQMDELGPYVFRRKKVTLEELKEMGFDHDKVDELELRT